MIVYAIPGLGTTKELYINTYFKNHQLVVLDWPEPSEKDDMRSYAAKFISQINTKEPFALLGVSFGGMLCVELSKIICPQKVILISTSKTRLELPWFIRLMKYMPLHKIINEQYHRKMAYHGRWFIGFGSAYIPEFLGMVDSMQQNYFRHCIHIICTWNNIELPNNYYHIHGTNDRLLSHKNVKANTLVRDGSHAMVVFNADEINALIENQLSRFL